MARSGNGSTSNYLSRTTAVRGTTPLTMACWFNVANVTDDMILVSLSASATENAYALVAGGTGVGDPVVALSYGSGVSTGGDSTAGFTANTWYHGTAVFTSATSRDAYINGANKGSDTTSSTVGGSFNRTGVGIATVGSGLLNPLNGAVAEVAIWGVALDASEILSLGQGVSPLLVRPTSIISYWPLLGAYSPEIEIRNTAPLTITGSMPAADHTRIFYPRCSYVRQVPPPVTYAPWIYGDQIQEMYG